MLATTAVILAFSAVPVHAAAVTYRDKLGRTVRIALPVQRAVFFQTYELIPALGLWEKVAGVSRYAYENDLMRTARPDLTRTVPSVGSGVDINMEALLRLRPDLVVTWTFRPENVRFMEGKGLAVIAVYPDSIGELYDVMRLHGRLFAREERAREVITAMEVVFRLVRERTAGMPEKERRKVLWLGSRQNSVAGGLGMTNEMIRLIGGANPAASMRQRNADVSMERIVAWNPDVVFIWGNATYDARDIVAHPQWRSVAAVRHGRVYKAPEWSTWSPRLAPVVLWMAMQAYPERFRDVHFAAEADRFSRRVFGIPHGKAGRRES